MIFRVRVYLIMILLGFTYTGWVYYESGKTNPAAGQMSADAIAGKKIWHRKNCIACHQLYGLGGFIGPDLTNVISQKDKGEAFSRVILKNGLIMPNFNFSDKEVDQLIAYLSYVDKTGTSDPKRFQYNWMGLFDKK